MNARSARESASGSETDLQTADLIQCFYHKVNDVALFAHSNGARFVTPGALRRDRAKKFARISFEGRKR